MKAKDPRQVVLREMSEWVLAKGEQKAHSDHPADLGYLLAMGDVLGHLRLMRSRLARESSSSVRRP
jgi:hypothetical protein